MTMAVMIFSLLGAAVLQALSPSTPLFAQARAPFLLSVVIYYALTREQNLVLTAACLAGLVQDSLSRIPLGYSAVCYCAVGAVISWCHEMVFNRSLLTHLLVGGISGVFASLLLFGLLWRGAVVSAGWEIVLMKAVGTGLLAMITTPIVFRLTDKLDRFLGNVPSEER